ncbi:uncharacterized protein ISCGN_019146 [Ixodes scapularis]
MPASNSELTTSDEEQQWEGGEDEHLLGDWSDFEGSMLEEKNLSEDGPFTLRDDTFALQGGSPRDFVSVTTDDELMERWIPAVLSVLNQQLLNVKPPHCITQLPRSLLERAFWKAGGTCESRYLVSGVTTDPKPCGFTRPRMAVRGFSVSEEKGILVVESSLGHPPGLENPKRPPAAAPDEPMDESGPQSQEDRPHSSSESLPSATCDTTAMEANMDPGTTSEQGPRDLTLMGCLDELRRLAGSCNNGPPLEEVLKHLPESKSSKDLEDIELSTQDQAKSGEGLPLVVGLLPDKTRATYTKFFEVVCTALILACGDKELQFGHFDFKMVTISTFEVAFPGAESKECLCHFAQCVIRKVAQLGLQLHSDPERPAFRRWARSLASLALLPERLVMPHWITSLKDQKQLTGTPRLDTTITELSGYFERQWLISPRQVALWNHFKDENNLRTTNHAEGQHRC